MGRFSHTNLEALLESATTAPLSEVLTEPAVLLGMAEAASGTPEGITWDAVLIAAGDSANGRHYPADVLQRATPLFEGVKAYGNHPSASELRDRPERSIHDVVGWFEGATWDASKRAITATLQLSDEGLQRKLTDAWRRNKRDLYGLSINAEGTFEEATKARGKRIVASLSRVQSVDLVTTPAAGGRLERLVASDDGAGTTAPPTDETPAPEGAPVKEATDMTKEELDALMGRFGEIVDAKLVTFAATQSAGAGSTDPVQVPAPKPPTTLPSPDPAPAPAPAPRPAPEVTVAVGVAEAERSERDAFRRELFEARLTAALEGSKLPEPSQARIVRMFEGRLATPEQIVATIREEKTYLATVAPRDMKQFGAVDTNTGAAVGDGDKEKWLKRFDGLYDDADVDGLPKFRGLREAFHAMRELQTGGPISYLEVSPVAIFESMRPRGRANLDRTASMFERYRRNGIGLEEAIHAHLMESILTSDWADVYADVLYKRLVNAYNTDTLYNDWRSVVSDVISVPDFQYQNFLRIGGFANLGIVPEGATYPALASPTDEAVQFKVAKYGGLHDITMETVVNDTVGAIRRIPIALARAAKRTLREDVLDQVTTANPVMGYDSVALYNSAHNNTGTTALSVAGLAAVKRAMRDQTAYGESAFQLGELNRPKALIVPNELEQVADRIVGGTSQNYNYALSSTPDADASIDPTYFHGKGMTYLVYDKMTDATDWFVVADPSMVPTMVVGFLNGNDQPELLVQDNPQVGSNFTADKVTTKVRLIWGRAVVDHRSFYREVVAG